MKGFKGFDKDLMCRAFQYALGKTFTHSGTTSLCNSGLHFCENPLDVLKFYGVAQKNRFAEVDAKQVNESKEGKDSKRVAKVLTIGAELTLSHLIGAGVKFIFHKASNPTTGNYAHSATTGDDAHSATTGNYAHSATTGDDANSATTGDDAHSATTGDDAHSATTGNYAHSATTGNYAHSATTGSRANSATTGNYAHSATTGDDAHSATTGNYAHSATTGSRANSATTGYGAHSATTGINAVAASVGPEGIAKGVKGSWLVLAEWKDGVPLAVKTVKIDGKRVKADTEYVLKNGKFTEVK